MRISELSPNIDIFNEVSPIYNKVIRYSGFRERISYTPTINPNVKNSKHKNRKMVWFAPPSYSAELTFIIGKYFLSLIDRHLPVNHIYRKLFNRHNLIISFSFTTN